MSDWNPRANEIFLNALDIESRDQCLSYLEEACAGDAELRSRVEALLQSYHDAGSFLQKPPVEIEPDRTVPYPDNQQVDPRHSGDDPTIIDATSPEDVKLDFLSPSEKPDCLGRLGSYEITAIVGCGGMGVVLKGRDPELNRVVAIKVLAPELASNAMARKRFLREARAAAAISHDHVVTIHAINQTDQLPHLVMEYVDGLSLQQRLDRSGPLELKEILRIGKQTAAGLAAAHAEGLIHRDIKPANILLENGVERVKITDFGLARAVDDVSLTQTGVVAGTPQYMSPEQAQGQRVDHRADLFSLGSVLYALCTGRPPFRAESTIAVIRRVCDDTPRPIQQVNPDIPDWLVAIIDKLLAKDPNQRFESATEVAELLGQHLAHIQQPSLVPQPVPVLQTTGRSEPPHATRRSTKQRWAAAAILLLVLFGSLSFTEATGRTQITSTVIRIVTGEGTLVIEVDDPGVSVQIDGEELIIKGAGVHEVRVRPGKHRIQALKNGKPVHQELVTITRGGKVVVKVTRIPERQTPPDAVLPTAELTEVRRFTGHTRMINSVAASPDGRFLLSAAHGGVVLLWNLETGKAEKSFAGHATGVLAVGFSRDGTAFSCSKDQTARRWDVPSGQEICRYVGHTARVSALAVSPDGKHLLTGSMWYAHDPQGVPEDNSLRLWDVETGNEVRRFEDVLFPITDVASAPDGKSIVAGGENSMLGLWDVETGKRIRRFMAPTGVRSVAFSADGTQVASSHVGGLKDGKWFDPEHSVIVLWDVKTGREIRRLRGHTAKINSIAFSPDGRFIASVAGGAYTSGRWYDADENTVRIWDAATGEKLARAEVGIADQSVAFTPDGRHVVTGGGRPGNPASADLRLWRLPESVWPKDDEGDLEKVEQLDDSSG